MALTVFVDIQFADLQAFRYLETKKLDICSPVKNAHFGVMKMSKTILAAVWVLFFAGGLLALSKEQVLIGLGMLAVAAFVLPTVFAIVWMRENKKKNGKN